MNEGLNNKELESKIDRYINGELNSAEVDELWAELIREEEYLDYLKSVANLKAVVERRRKKKRNNQFKYYAAAAVIALLITVIGVMQLSNWPVDNKIKPIDQIELNYYRSGNGSVIEGASGDVVSEAIRLANSKQVEKAIAILKTELESVSEPRHVAYLNLNLGIFFYNEAQYKEAIDCYNEVIGNRAQIDILMLEKAYWYTGNAYLQLDQLSQAKTNIEKAYELDGAYRRVAKAYLEALG